MNRFSFRLEALLEMRKNQEENVKQILAQKNHQIIDAQKKVNSINDELQMLEKSEFEQRKHVHNPVLFKFSISYRYKLKHDLVYAIREVDKLKADSNTIQKELVEAIKKRRAVEIVKDRRFQEWKKKYKIREQNFMDDISQQSFIRQNQ